MGLNGLSSRERVLMALAHREPDCVPIDCGGMRSSGITAVAYGRLKDYLGLAQGEIRVFDVRQQLAIIEQPVLERFEADVLPLDPDQLGSWQPYRLPDGRMAYTLASCEFEEAADGALYWRDGGRRIAKRPQGGLYFDYTDFPLADATSVADLEAFDFGGFTTAQIEALRVTGERLYRQTDKAIMGRFSGSIYERGQKLRGFERFMLDLAEGGQFLQTLLEKMTEAHLSTLKVYLEAVGGFINLIQMSDDLGTQTGLQISPAMYRRWIKPYHKRIYGYVRDHYPHVHVFLHCCGAIAPLLPDLIDAGVQVLNPVQTAARGMDSRYLKREFGKYLTFWGGGAESQTTLPYGTPEQIADQVRERMEVFGPGGGYVFTPIHNIQADVPPENIVAVYEAARRFRCYR